MTSRSTFARIRTLPVFIAFTLNLFLGPVTPLLSSPVAALGASSFNALDGNLTDDGAETDWCTPAPNRQIGLDSPSGPNDTSFVSGPNKEDHDVPTVGTGSIPGNKDDIVRQYIASETVGTDLFVYLAWVRADPTGTATIDFEFNQSDQVSSNGTTKVRTDGDLLVSFDFQANPGSGGGYIVDLKLRTWDSNAVDTPDPTSTPPNTGAWVNEIDLDASGLAEGSVNFFGTSQDPIAIDDCVTAAAGDTIDNGEFGEAVLNLSDILGGDCRAFGSIFTKSRSSGSSFSSDLKDLLAPIPVDLSTCSKIIILKEDQFGDPVGGATFTITPNPFLANHTGSLVVLDDTGAGGYVGADEDPAPGVIEFNDVEPYSANGGYAICETSPPPGDYLWPPATDPYCFTKVVGANVTVTFGPFVNELLFPVLRIVKSPDEDQADAAANDVTAGDDASFTITLYNDGTGTADGATLEDDLPGMSSGWDIDSTDWADGCEITGSAGATQHLSCGPEDIEASGSRFVTVTTETQAPEDCGDHDNPLATGDADNADSVTDSGNFDVLCGDLDVEKTPDEDAQDEGANDIFAGDDAIFSIVTSNVGDGEARDSTLNDATLPIVENGWAIIPNPGAEQAWLDCEITGDPGEQQTLSCGPEDIEAGGSRTVTLKAETELEDCGTLSNPFAIVESTNDGSDSDAGEIDVLCPDVSVEKTTDTPEINAGDEARYTITVMASGIGTSHDVNLHDDLPPVDGSWLAELASPDGDDLCAVVGDDLDCSFGDMEPGDQKVVHLTYTTTPDDCGDLLNDVSVSAEVDLDDADNSVLDVLVEVNCPDIDVDKTGSGTVDATESVYFEITVSNLGDGDAYDFLFSDTLPSVAGGWALAAGFDTSPATCEVSGLALTCNVADDILLAGDSFTVRVEADTVPADCGELKNEASAWASNEATNEEDEVLLNNIDGHNILVQCPDLTATKDADGDDPETVSAGEEIGFTITVSNSDAAGTGNALDVQLDDLLPAGSGLDWSEDPDNADCDILGLVGAQTLHCDFGDLAPGDSVSVHVVSDTTQSDCATYPNVADITSANHEELNPSDAVTVECPGLNISKLADNSPIDAGETASYTVVVWNVGPGTALNASWSDELPGGVSWSIELQDPDGDDDCASSIDSEGNQSASCNFGDLPPSSMEDGKIILISGETDREDCAGLENTAFAFADNDDTVQATAFIEVRCPLVAIEKVNNTVAPVLPGTNVSFTLTVSVSDGPADDVVVVDTLPAGYDDPTTISNGGVWDGTARTITWDLGDDVANGDYLRTYQARVSASAKHGDALVNVAIVTSSNSQCPDEENLEPECDDDSTVIVRVPTLVIDKSASTEVVHFVFNPDGSVKSVTPAQVTWTLTYTLTNGPVTNAVITDPLPAFLTFVSASNGGTFAAGVITWNLGTLTTGGSVSFVTTVNANAPAGPAIENIATIDSTETLPDTGQDSIRVTSEQVLESTGTPSASVPNTAGFMANGQPVTIPVELMVAFFLLSLGGLTFANVRAVRRRR